MQNEYPSNFLWQQMQLNNYTAKDLSIDSDVSDQTIRKYIKCDNYYERGRVQTFIQLADALGLCAENLVNPNWVESSVIHEPTDLNVAIMQHYGAANVTQTRNELRAALGRPHDYLCLYRYYTYTDTPFVRDAYVIANYLGYSIKALWGN